MPNFAMSNWSNYITARPIVKLKMHPVFRTGMDPGSRIVPGGSKGSIYQEFVLCRPTAQAGAGDRPPVNLLSGAGAVYPGQTHGKRGLLTGR